APTASLHFTWEILESIQARGVQIAKIILNVGLGTFAPIAAETFDDHPMHCEYYSIGGVTARGVNRAKEEGRRVIAAGTTVVRALEACMARYGELRPVDDETNIFITPGHRFAVVDGLLTNFHLPKSTLLLLVSAFAGRHTIRNAYQEAIRHNYRFFSFGDAMFIQP
ncbi:MAG: S-adenosylmethionine:tRNA ribosyltransferase-isomerase, partial [Candidatus Eremiobacteraeota bacterium]|nr:S-adenosylmethionine:tRNA ribosyltransferase-isomerase [Candidatus Eremiobacteraeota bacterium]